MPAIVVLLSPKPISTSSRPLHVAEEAVISGEEHKETNKVFNTQLQGTGLLEISLQDWRVFIGGIRRQKRIFKAWTDDYFDAVWEF
jgi:hypothetical protein